MIPFWCYNIIVGRIMFNNLLAFCYGVFIVIFIAVQLFIVEDVSAANKEKIYTLENDATARNLAAGVTIRNGKPLYMYGQTQNQAGNILPFITRLDNNLNSTWGRYAVFYGKSSGGFDRILDSRFVSGVSENGFDSSGNPLTSSHFVGAEINDDSGIYVKMLDDGTFSVKKNYHLTNSRVMLRHIHLVGNNRAMLVGTVYDKVQNSNFGLLVMQIDTSTGAVIFSKVIDRGLMFGLGTLAAFDKSTNNLIVAFAHTGGPQLKLLKIDLAGNVVFSNEYLLPTTISSSVFPFVFLGGDLLIDKDNNLVIAGVLRTIPTSTSVYHTGFIIKLQQSGNVSFYKEYVVDSFPGWPFKYGTVLSPIQTTDGNYVVSGAANYPIHGNNTWFMRRVLLKVNSNNGNIIWKRGYREESFTTHNRVVELPNKTLASTSGQWEYKITVTDANGNGSCMLHPVSPPIIAYNLTPAAVQPFSVTSLNVGLKVIDLKHENGKVVNIKTDDKCTYP